jgi:hypothetical protein
VDWGKVNGFAFFPPLLSIYLLFISSLAKFYLNGQIQRIVDRNVLRGHEDFVRNIASGWAAQLGFFNAMFASFFSTMSVWATSRSFGGIVLTLALLLLIFAPMVWYIFSHEPDQIESVRSVTGKFAPASACRAVLLLVNIILIVAIAINQQLS